MPVGQPIIRENAKDMLPSPVAPPQLGFAYPSLAGAVMVCGIGRDSMRRRGVSLVGVVYLVIGLVVAGTNGYLVAWNIPGNIIEGLAAIVLWPLVIFGVDLHTLIA